MSRASQQRQLFLVFFETEAFVKTVAVNSFRIETGVVFGAKCAIWGRAVVRCVSRL